MLSNRVLALQQQQQSHFVPNHYAAAAASYYPNYMPHQPIPVSHPPPHPPPSSHHTQPPMPPSVHPQQTIPMRMPNMSATATGTHPPFFTPTSVPNQSSVPSTVPSFQFGISGTVPAPSSQTTITNTLPSTTTTPTKSIFSNTPKFTMPDMSTKPSSTSSSSSVFPVTTTASTVTNDKPSNNTPFSFGTVGNLAQMFGTGGFPSMTSTTLPSKPTINHEDDDGEGGGEDDSYEPNVSFKPIVTLSAVEVKTGEEDENVLFCERGKLYRFDTDSNQMKERGIGEMKILQHKTTKAYRILMRREQVLKLCANHQITSQMELKPHQGTENAYVWSAMDFADGEAKHETLCIRFKSNDAAKKFVKIFNDAKEGTANAQQ